MDRVEVKERLDVDDATGSELWSKTKVKTKKLRKKGHPGVRADWSSFVTTAKARVSSRHPHAADVHVEHAVINVLPQTIPAMALEAVRDLDSWLAQLDAVLSADATKISSPDPQAPVQQWHSVCFESGSRAALQAVAHDLEPLATLLLDSAPTSLRPAGDDGDDADVDAGADVDAKSGDARRGDCDVECVRGGYPSWIVHVAKNHSQHSE
ncbi:hypothetical protein PTSG_09601 [Salpingoeca rosetta]|uniref:Uncharacterized protein n=1 Tax=Salpingoeca rosetta (strain ATCC 50818 / BSB-021) TaxID=946362 RepID=F2ULG9_SALR5|nr:uncharacterized protein PTSG_09601 [Salpingoeca rosetta]EGD77968.1 hypothetical protein PTSG_09601 [Salpingoeca rosetta]|eukprot:XP_004990030.1 hypothetical protein PTSG_09601 [Salpingoeca rosetta]